MSVIETALKRLRRSDVPDIGASAHKAAEPEGDPRQPPRAVASEPQPAPAKRVTIDLRQLRADGYVPEEGQERRFADYYREIKRPLIQRALAADATPERRLIMVSSALPGEGKTFVTLNLAFSMARERDVSVLLIDADLPKAHISRALGIHAEPGLLDSLADESRDVESLILGTSIAGLDILPAGRQNEHAAELIASARMREVVARLVTPKPRRLAILDTPPLLIASEARALVGIPGQMILVARSGHTPCQALLDALGHVDKSKVSGLVLNEGRFLGGETYYGYPAYEDLSAQFRDTHPPRSQS